MLSTGLDCTLNASRVDAPVSVQSLHTAELNWLDDTRDSRTNRHRKTMPPSTVPVSNEIEIKCLTGAKASGFSLWR